jgi:hypothetical protein
MNTIQFELGSGASIALPRHIVAKSLIDSLESQVSPVRPGRHQIGEYVHGQGGIFVGDILGADGVTYGLIAGKEVDIGKAKWGKDGDLKLSDWDGLSNTNALRGKGYPAIDLAAGYEADGHVDFYLPSRRELMIAAANVPGSFGKQGWYATSTPCGSDGAWVVGFEYGRVGTDDRRDEFRVRPFRRFIY